MFYLFLGDDYLSKDSQINALKTKYLPTKESLNFDFEALDARQLDAADLKKAFVALPVAVSQRVILIRNIEKAKSQNQEILLDFLGKKEKHHVIICDTHQRSLGNAFGKKLESLCKVTTCFLKQQERNVFDVTNAIEARNTAKALEMLHDLFDRGDHPLQLMSGFIWFWGKSRSRIPAENFNKGLQVLQEVDINIKRSRLGPQEAMEVAVVKLSELMK